MAAESRRAGQVRTACCSETPPMCAFCLPVSFSQQSCRLFSPEYCHLFRYLYLCVCVRETSAGINLMSALPFFTTAWSPDIVARCIDHFRRFAFKALYYPRKRSRLFGLLEYLFNEGSYETHAKFAVLSKQDYQLCIL